MSLVIHVPIILGIPIAIGTGQQLSFLLFFEHYRGKLQTEIVNFIVMNPLFIKKVVILFVLISHSFLSCHSQADTKARQNTPAHLSDMAKAAYVFLQTLSEKQKVKIQFGFNDEERYNWHYIPRSRKGLTLNEMTDQQIKAAFALLRTALSDTGFNKANSIMQLENVLREVENRSATDTYRDPGNYSFSIFGNPATDTIWGWRLEGHHIAFNFSSEDNRLVSGTPGFLGSNPAVVLSGSEKGKYILKDEAELGFALLHSLKKEQTEKAIISNDAPGEILTAASRNAMINDPKGILFNELDSQQQKIFLQLLSIYIHRYTRLFAEGLMKEIDKAGLNNLRFAWAGEQQPGIGHPHYYRIQGPTIIIEYDNTQNNANHIHTVIRDLKNDFGGDELLKHYKNDQH
ncbi:MAG TPA: DUF3500 domain-containing protein [Chitinophagaceae bacterium]|nr:DUF3500 domain-containing protein [Chitinophagaceae bacterium]